MTDFHLMAKPIGPTCNLDCTYCFYLEKESLFESNSKVLSEEILAAYTKKYIASQHGPEVEFTWQGGEPMLAGLEFYRKALRCQNQYKGTKAIRNSIQTNGVLIDDSWCRFLKKNNFLVGLSLDGPEDFHDVNRKDKLGQGSFNDVIQSLKCLQKYDVDFNVLTTVNSTNAEQALKVYNFFKEMDIQYIQFIPVIERKPGQQSDELKLTLATPDDIKVDVTEWSVKPEVYGDFLIAIFDEWVRHDIGKVFIMNFEWALGAAIYGISSTCHHAKTCGTAGVIEKNGDIYSCDHYVYPSNMIGNILEDDLSNIFESSKQTNFGNKKFDELSEKCKSCEVLDLCYGGCPKHRFDQGQNYLCESYKRFFNHIKPHALLAKQLIRQGKSLTELMKLEVE